MTSWPICKSSQLSARHCKSHFCTLKNQNEPSSPDLCGNYLLMKSTSLHMHSALCFRELDKVSQRLLTLGKIGYFGWSNSCADYLVKWLAIQSGSRRHATQIIWILSESLMEFFSSKYSGIHCGHIGASLCAIHLGPAQSFAQEKIASWTTCYGLV